MGVGFQNARDIKTGKTFLEIVSSRSNNTNISSSTATKKKKKKKLRRGLANVIGKNSVSDQTKKLLGQ